MTLSLLSPRVPRVLSASLASNPLRSAFTSISKETPSASFPLLITILSYVPVCTPYARSLSGELRRDIERTTPEPCESSETKAKPFLLLRLILHCSSILLTGKSPACIAADIPAVFSHNEAETSLHPPGFRYRLALSRFVNHRHSLTTRINPARSEQASFSNLIILSAISGSALSLFRKKREPQGCLLSIRQLRIERLPHLRNDFINELLHRSLR